MYISEMSFLLEGRDGYYVRCFMITPLLQLYRFGAQQPHYWSVTRRDDDGVIFEGL